MISTLVRSANAASNPFGRMQRWADLYEVDFQNVGRFGTVDGCIVELLCSTFQNIRPIRKVTAG